MAEDTDVSDDFEDLFDEDAPDPVEESPEEVKEEDSPDPEEPESPEPKEEEEESKDEPEESDKPEEEESSEGEDTNPKESEEDKKLIAQEAFKRREAERKLREEREQREKENLDRYLEEAEGDEVELAKRQAEVERHFIQKEKIAVNAEKLEVGIQRFAAESDLLKDGDPAMQEAIAEALDDFEAMYVVKDKDGNPTEVKADVYQYLNKKADSIRRLTSIGARQQTKNKESEKSRTVPRPTRTPKEPKADQGLEGFDEEASRW